LTPSLFLRVLEFFFAVLAFATAATWAYNSATTLTIFVGATSTILSTFFIINHLVFFPDPDFSSSDDYPSVFEIIFTLIWCMLWLVASILMTLLVSSFPTWNNQNVDESCFYNRIPGYHIGFHYWGPGCYNRKLLTSTIFCWLTFVVLIIQTILLTMSLLWARKK